MVRRYAASRGDGAREAVYRAYLGHTAFVNNWDLVDCSAGHIVGAHLFELFRTLEDFHPRAAPREG